jgi:hypothetical protein
MEDPAATLLSGLAYLAIALALAIAGIGLVTTIVQLPFIRKYRRRSIVRNFAARLQNLQSRWPIESNKDIALERRRSIVRDLRLEAEEALLLLVPLTLADWRKDPDLRHVVGQYAPLLRQLLGPTETREEHPPGNVS